MDEIEKLLDALVEGGYMYEVEVEGGAIEYHFTEMGEREMAALYERHHA
jgi:hypothetical protein